MRRRLRRAAMEAGAIFAVVMAIGVAYQVPGTAYDALAAVGFAYVGVLLGLTFCLLSLLFDRRR